MMRYYLLILTCLISLVGGAQISLETGTPSELEKGQYLERIVGVHDGAIYFTISDYKGFVSGVGRVNMDGSGFKLAPFPAVKAHNMIVTSLGSDLIVIRTETQEGRMSLLYERFDSNLFLSDAKELAGHSTGTSRSKGSFSVVLSNSQDKVGVLQDQPPGRDKREILTGFVVDLSGKMLWKKEYESGLQKTSRPNHEIMVSDAGELHILKRTRKELSFTFNLYSIYANGSKVNKQTINLGGPKITEILMASTPQNQVILSGFYSVGDMESSDGYFYHVLDSTGKVVMKSQKKHPSGVLQAYLGKKASKKKTLQNVYIEEIISTGDRVYLFLEKVVDQNFHKKGSDYYEHLSDFGPAMALVFDSLGNSLGSQEFIKRQRSWNDGGFFSSYYVSTEDDKLSVFYNKIDADDKTYKTVVPFKGNNLLLEAENQQIETVKNIDVKGPDHLISPRLLLRTPESWFLLLTDHERRSIIPASFKL